MRHVILVSLLLLLVGCGSTGPQSRATATADQVHAQWVAVHKANDAAAASTVATATNQDLFINQSIEILYGYRRTKGEPSTVETQLVRTQGPMQYGLSIWKYNTTTLCFETLLSQEVGKWRVNNYGVADCPK